MKLLFGPNYKVSAKALRIMMNLWPCIRGCGAKIKRISKDFKSTEVHLPLNLKTRNYVGTIFGGSIYSCVDPFPMLMLLNILGKEYIVWDRAATVRFKKPGTDTLVAKINLTDDEIETIKKDCETNHSIDRTYTVELKDKDGNVCAEIEKVIYIRKKDRFKSQPGAKLS